MYHPRPYPKKHRRYQPMNVRCDHSVWAIVVGTPVEENRSFGYYWVCVLCRQLRLLPAPWEVM